MTRKRILMTALMALCALVLNAQAQNRLAVVTEMRVVRMDYASMPGFVGATLDFSVAEVLADEPAVGYLNAVTDLNWWSSDGLEWVCRNIPVHVSQDMTSGVQGVWFDPGAFDTPDNPGEHNVYAGEWYPVWAFISDQQIQRVPDWTALEFWDYCELPGGCAVWGLHDTLLGLGGEISDPPAGTKPAVAKGEVASPLRTTMPDIAQKSMECGPTSCANSLIWLAKKHDFEEKLPENQDDLIKGLMKAMAGSDARPFPGLSAGQMRAGKIKYATENKLPIVVKGGHGHDEATGAKAFDFIKKEFDEGEDVEMLINWPGGGAHWVTVVGYAVSGDRLFVKVNDPDDGKTGTVTWELDRAGNFINPKGAMNRAVSESFVPQDDIKIPPDTTPGHHAFGGDIVQNDDGTTSFVEDASSSPEHSYDPASHNIHVKNEEKDNETKIVRLTATFFVPMENDRDNPRFNPRTAEEWATIKTMSQIVVRNRSYSYGGSSGQFLEIEQKWKLVPNPKFEDIDMKVFFAGAHPLRLLRFKVDTWCLPEKVKIEQTDGHTTVREDGPDDTVEISLVHPPTPGASVEIIAQNPTGRLDLSPPSLTFDDSNWDIPRTIRIAAPDNSEADTVPIELVQLSLTSTDPIFAGSYLPRIPVTVIDDDCPPWARPSADLNGDCCVDFEDLSIFADQWLDCTTCDD